MLRGGKFRLGEVNCEFWTFNSERFGIWYLESIDHLLQEICTGLKKAGNGCPVLCYETDIFSLILTFVLPSLNQ